MNWKQDRVESLGEKLRQRYLDIPKAGQPEILRRFHVGRVTVPPQHPHNSPEGGGAIYHAEGQVLYAVAHALGAPALEIGADRGVSTRYILRALEERDRPNELLFSVDVQHRWRPRIAEDPGRRLHQVTADSTTLQARAFPRIAWAFIDGDHFYDGVASDIRLAKATGARVLVLHDCSPWIPRATRSGESQHAGSTEGSDAFEAVTDLLWDDPEWSLTFIHTVAGLVLAEKNA